MSILKSILTTNVYLKRFPTVLDFPTIGSTKYLYLAEDFGGVYYWNGSAYVSIQDSNPIIDGEVNTYADLPSASTHNGEVWIVKTTTGTIFVNRKVAGFYVSNGASWALITPVDIDGYQKLITSPTANNIITTDVNGQGQDSGKSFSTDGTLAGNSDNIIATQKAVKTYADSKVEDAINDGETTKAPSQNAVFDALSLKMNLASGSFNAFTGKTTPVDADILVGENSANSYSKIKITFFNAFNYIKNKFSARKIYYVSASGDNANNGLTPETAVLTLAQALTLSDNSGNQIVVLPGTYSETTTITDQNTTITAPNNETRGIVNFNGSLTVNHSASSLALNGLNITSLSFTGAGSLYLDKSTIAGFTNNSAGYLRATQTSFENGTISITGSGYKNFENGCALAQTTINNAGAVITIKDAQKVVASGLANTLTLTNGILALRNTTVIAASSSYFALTVAAGSIDCENVKFINADGTDAKINIASGVLYSLRNCSYASSSTISGTNLGTVSVFDNIKLNSQTASKILGLDANKNINSLDTTTYPSLTELSYVKGATSAIQTQINGLKGTLYGQRLSSVLITSGPSLNIISTSSRTYTFTGSSDTIVNFPNASTLSGLSAAGNYEGDLFTFYNKSSAIITIKNVSGTVLAYLNAGEACSLFLQDNFTSGTPTTDGVWVVSYEGVPTFTSAQKTTLTTNNTFRKNQIIFQSDSTGILNSQTFQQFDGTNWGVIGRSYSANNGIKLDDAVNPQNFKIDINSTGLEGTFAPALSGDIIAKNNGGTIALTINDLAIVNAKIAEDTITNSKFANNTITNAKLAQANEYSILGNDQATPANIQYLTADQVLAAINNGSATLNSLAINRGGTAARTQQDAINNLTNVSAATNEYVLTKDTATGNAIFKPSVSSINYIGQIVNASNSTIVTLGKLSARIILAGGGFAAMQISAQNGNFTAAVQSWWSSGGGVASNSPSQYDYAPLTTSWVAPSSTNSFNQSGIILRTVVIDLTNSAIYRATFTIGASLNNCSITIEKFL